MAARIAGIHFSVQVVYNRRRRTCAVFAGDINEAHHAACRMANLHYRTATFKGADIVIANNYPQNIQSDKGPDRVNRSLRDGDARVAIYPYCAIRHLEAGLDETTA